MLSLTNDGIFLSTGRSIVFDDRLGKNRSITTVHIEGAPNPQTQETIIEILLSSTTYLHSPSDEFWYYRTVDKYFPRLGRYDSQHATSVVVTQVLVRTEVDDYSLTAATLNFNDEYNAPIICVSECLEDFTGEQSLSSRSSAPIPMFAFVNDDLYIDSEYWRYADDDEFLQFISKSFHTAESYQADVYLVSSIDLLDDRVEWFDEIVLRFESYGCVTERFVDTLRNCESFLTTDHRRLLKFG